MITNPFWAQADAKRSWHALAASTNSKAACGRRIVLPVLEVRPGNQKTCESCLRIIAPR